MDEAQIRELTLNMHKRGGACPGFVDITDFQDVQPLNLMPLDFFSYRAPSQQETVKAALPLVSSDEMTKTVTKLSSYPTRLYTTDTGKQAAEWIHGEFTRLAAEAGRKDVKVSFFEHKWKQPSVIAEIPGTDQADELVVLGAHEDSINMSNPSAPGADDDASGVATVMEVFRVLMKTGYKPKRTIQFMTYAAEEVGLFGSQDIAKSYQKAGKKVVGALQFDMTMFPGSGKTLVFIVDYVNPELTKFTEALVDEYVKIEWKEDKCGYGCSDHASWNRAGYASVFPFEALFDDSNSKIHSKNDLLGILDPTFGAKFAELGVAYAIELGSTK